jgi:peptidoglycan glycosyltransferase
MISLSQAFALSCNTTFAQIGLQLEPSQLVGAAEAFGFGLPVPFELAAAPSSIPPAADFADDAPALAQSAIGQRDVRATPLQMALVAAGIANGGWIMSPYLVAEVFNAEGVVTERTAPVGWRRAMSPATADVLADLMERVVTSGTGGNAAIAGVRIAGKTGTAEVPGAPPDVWFVGFGPVGARPGTPQIAIAVVVEAGGDLGDNGTGGAVAAPIARAVLSAFFEK